MDGARFIVVAIFARFAVGKFLNARNVNGSTVPGNVLERNGKGFQVKLEQIFEGDRSAARIVDIATEQRMVGSSQNPQVHCQREVR